MSSGYLMLIIDLSQPLALFYSYKLNALGVVWWDERVVGFGLRSKRALEGGGGGG